MRTAVISLALVATRLAARRKDLLRKSATEMFVISLILAASATVGSTQTELGACNGSNLKESIKVCGDIINSSAPQSLRSAAYRNRAIRYMALTQYQDALDDINMALSTGSPNALDYMVRGGLFTKTGNTASAMNDLNQAIKLQPNLASAYTARGLLNYQMGKLDAAIKDSTKAIDLDSRQQAAYNNRGAALRDKGEYDRALSDLNVIIRTNPQAARPLYNRALVYQRMGNKEKALQDYEAALVLAPNDRDALAGRDAMRGTTSARNLLDVDESKGASESSAGTANGQPVYSYDPSNNEKIVNERKRLVDLLDKGKRERLSPADKQLLYSSWFWYQSTASLPVFAQRGKPALTPLRSKEIEDQFSDVTKIQKDYDVKFAVADGEAKKQEEINEAYGVYLAIYFSSKKCSDDGLVFHQEVVDNIASILKEKGRTVPQDLKDKEWQLLQNHFNSIVVSEQDCSQAMKQSMYMLPQSVFTLKDAPKNPF